MSGKSTVLYSSSLGIILMALSSWLTHYAANPGAADFGELQALQAQMNSLTQSNSSDVKSNQINQLMAWWYPGEPACNAKTEATQVQFDTLKPEYFAVRAGGVLEFMTAADYQCNGYSPAEVEQVKKLSNRQFVMVSSSYAKDMQAFLTRDEEGGAYTSQLVDFVVTSGFTGVELDFEDYGGWTPNIYEQYKAFVTRLGTALNAKNKQLIVNLPPVSNSIEEQWYTFRLEEIEALPVDYILVMGYDYQFDHGVGEPIAPLDWLANVITFTKGKIQDDSKIIIGVPSYGYIGNKQSGVISILTNEQARGHSLYALGKRDSRSQELIAESASTVLVYQDQQSVDTKLAVVERNGIDKASIWHLGGNALPSANY